jgi:hypothetical protein
MCLFLNVRSQNLIGYHEKEIRQIMRDRYKNMNFQNFTNNSTFRYLKYSDSEDNQTLLFFLNADSVCKSVRLVCDKNLKDLKIKELNANYKKNGENRWRETINGKNYNIDLKDEEWTFSVTITLKE